VTTSTGVAQIVTGRGIRSLKRQRSRQLRQLAKKQSRCAKHSRSFKKLQRAKNKISRRAKRRIRDLRHKAKQARISCATSSERGTSSQCPSCWHRHKPRGRRWACRACGFAGHRDLVGAVNMHTLAYGTQVEFPRSADVSPSWLVQVKE
jgi:putative transposase